MKRGRTHNRGRGRRKQRLRLELLVNGRIGLEVVVREEERPLDGGRYIPGADDVDVATGAEGRGVGEVGSLDEDDGGARSQARSRRRKQRNRERRPHQLSSSELGEGTGMLFFEVEVDQRRRGDASHARVVAEVVV